MNYLVGLITTQHFGILHFSHSYFYYNKIRFVLFAVDLLWICIVFLEIPENNHSSLYYYLYFYWNN